MKIEEEIFQRCKIDFTKLILYGFVKENNDYVYSKNIMNATFRIDICVTQDEKVNVKIIDLSFNEEYTNFRYKTQVGDFVAQVRESLESTLYDIKNQCTVTQYFFSKQANEIYDLIQEKYHDLPEMMWEKHPGYGVYRNSYNQKWYALIMNINIGKIAEGNEEVEIINVKLKEEKIAKLLNQKGFYKAYHMNKKNWISIILDETLSTHEIMSYVEESHAFTEVKDEWIVPANPKYYDIINCFSNTDVITWKQSSTIKVGDIVYLYVTSPYSAILYKCCVLDTDIPYEYQDQNLSMKKVMKIRLLKTYDKNQYTFEKLKEYGIKAIRGPRRISSAQSVALNKK